MKSKIGIHTYSVSMMLTAKQYHVIKKHLPALQIKELDYFRGTEILYSGFFEKQGIKIHLTHFQMLYQLKIQIEPCRILCNDNPAALYVPTKKIVSQISKSSR